MRYAISYVSTKSPSVKEEEIYKVLEDSCSYNNENNITGLLVYFDGNFFQLIEGEKEAVRELFYNKIKKDSHHRNIIKFLEKEITNPAYDGYDCDIVNNQFKIDTSKLHKYINHLKVLDPEVRKPVTAILKSIIPDIESRLATTS
ncbi:blue light sensor protein [Christiangramia fulva]|uniref:Blue light sensor protein n=1 Tax=Christiangramia fulva TaxID=2126553 RepID=A0A2R3Z579_9FLAO|nr:BLUF domain-containing protein [Christiangramia fulva]AVR45436.1 blue light sensor protein [Christiangramia fulva]